MELKIWLRQQRGRQVELARHLNIKPPQVADWLSYDKPVPVHHMAAIEVFSCGAVTRQEMRPNDWHRIWPELVIDNNTTQPAAPDGQALGATEE